MSVHIVLLVGLLFVLHRVYSRGFPYPGHRCDKPKSDGISFIPSFCSFHDFPFVFLSNEIERGRGYVGTSFCFGIEIIEFFRFLLLCFLTVVKPFLPKIKFKFTSMFRERQSNPSHNLSSFHVYSLCLYHVLRFQPLWNLLFDGSKRQNMSGFVYDVTFYEVRTDDQVTRVDVKVRMATLQYFKYVPMSSK